MKHFYPHDTFASYLALSFFLFVRLSVSFSLCVFLIRKGWCKIIFYMKAGMSTHARLRPVRSPWPPRLDQTAARSAGGGGPGQRGLLGLRIIRSVICITSNSSDILYSRGRGNFDEHRCCLPCPDPFPFRIHSPSKSTMSIIENFRRIKITSCQKSVSSNKRKRTEQNRITADAH